MVSTLLKKGFYLKLHSQINCIVYLYTFFQWVGILASYMQSSESLRVWKEKQNNIENWTKLKWNTNFITVISTRNSILNELRGLKKYIQKKFLAYLKSQEWTISTDFPSRADGVKNIIKSINCYLLSWCTISFSKLTLKGMYGTMWRDFKLRRVKCNRLKLANLAHYDGAINRKFEIRQCLPDSGYDPLHSVDLLP